MANLKHPVREAESRLDWCKTLSGILINHS
jgi:hypothetical protein